MNEKEKFEDIIASKFTEAEFPFDEGNWDGAEEMIDSYRKKEKRRKYAYIFFSGILLGVIIMFPFINKINEKISNPISEVTKTPIERVGAKAIQYSHSGHKTRKNKIPFTMPVISNEKVFQTIPSVDAAIVKLDVIPVSLDPELDLKKAYSDSLLNLFDIPTNNQNKANRPWNISASVGGNYVKGFSLNPIQGIEISKGITEHLEVGTGAYYTYLTVGSGGVKTITTHTNYDFGYQSDITSIKTNKLHYVVIPVFAKYNINDKNSFIIGANMFALFTSSNSVTTYKESYGEKQNMVSKKTSGYSNGINTFDVGLLAGYKRKLFGNLSASIYFNYGLMNIKKNDYYNENKFERNISGQFMLTYKLQ